MYQNPFYLSWNKGWSFTIFLEGGLAKIEARGYGITMTSDIQKRESPKESADRIILKEEIMRKSIYYSWLRSLNKNK